MTRIASVDLVRRVGAGFLAAAATLAAGEWRIAGSDLLGPDFTREIQTAARDGGLTVALELRGTRAGIEALEAGRADAALLLLPDGVAPPGDPITTRIVAWHVTVLAVPETAVLQRISIPEARAIFTQADGSDPGTHAVRLALSPETSPAWPHFRSRVLGAGEGVVLSVGLLPDNARLAGVLRITPNALAITDVGIAAEPGLRLLALSAGPAQPAFPPTLEHVQGGQYALRMPLRVAFRRADAPALLPFLKFLLGERAAQALTGAGFMPLPAGERARLAFEFEEMR